MMPLNLRTNNRILILGATQDGKTTLALKLVARVAKISGDPVVLLNPGAEQKLYELFGESRYTIDTGWPAQQHVVPVIKRKKTEYGAFFWPQLVRGNVLTYIDEVFMLGDVRQWPLGLQYLYQAGARRNCGTVAVSQRPVGIPTFMFDQSDHIFVGDVRGAALSHVEHATQQSWSQAMQARRQYEFLYWSRHIKAEPEVVRLD